MKLPGSLTLFISKFKVLWTEWNIQTFVIASLTFQLVLILVGSFRKQTSNGLIIVSVWLSYLLADWVATQAVGLISRGPPDTCTCLSPSSSSSSYDTHNNLYAFWAQFLLLHLGGPDTITALALEDNELWLRTGLHLGTQAYATSGLLVKSIHQSTLWIPTVLIFFAGVIKYAERVSALLRGRLSNFDAEPDNLNHANQLEAYNPMRTHNADGKRLTNVEMVRDAFYFFHHYKCFYADAKMWYNNRTRSMLYFKRRTPEEAFEVIEIQLNFAYEAFYTKMAVIHTSLVWKILRPIVLVFEVACLVIWCLSKKHGLRGHDIRITYALLIAAIAVDVLGIFRVQLSYWNIAHLKRGSLIRRWFYEKLLSSYWKRTWGRYWRKEEAPFWPCFRRAFSRRWSESIPQMNMVDFCVDQRSKGMQKAVEFFGIKEVLDGFKYVTKKWFSNHLRDFIYNDLKEKTEWVDGMYVRANYICYCKGKWACDRLKYSDTSAPVPRVYNIFLLVTMEEEGYEFALLHWHVITELFYWDEYKEGNVGMDPYREICKTLSDYMIYLLFRQTEMIVTALEGKPKDVLRRVSDEIKKICTGMCSKRKEARHQGAAKIIQESTINTEAGQRLKLHHIMNELKALEEAGIGKWEFMAKVWAELVYYAAIRCKTSLHAAQLKQGGEFLSFVWLLMVQLGFGLYQKEHETTQLAMG